MPDLSERERAFLLRTFEEMQAVCESEGVGPTVAAMNAADRLLHKLLGVPHGE